MGSGTYAEGSAWDLVFIIRESPRSSFCLFFSAALKDSPVSDSAPDSPASSTHWRAATVANEDGVCVRLGQQYGMVWGLLCVHMARYNTLEKSYAAALLFFPTGDDPNVRLRRAMLRRLGGRRRCGLCHVLQWNTFGNGTVLCARGGRATHVSDFFRQESGSSQGASARVRFSITASYHLSR